MSCLAPFGSCPGICARRTCSTLHVKKVRTLFFFTSPTVSVMIHYMKRFLEPKTNVDYMLPQVSALSDWTQINPFAYDSFFVCNMLLTVAFNRYIPTTFPCSSINQHAI